MIYNKVKSFGKIALISFLMEMVGKTDLNEDTNWEAKLRYSQYTFCPSVSTETALYKFVR